MKKNKQIKYFIDFQCKAIINKVQNKRNMNKTEKQAKDDCEIIRNPYMCPVRYFFFPFKFYYKSATLIAKVR